MARDGGGGIGSVIGWAAAIGGIYLIYSWWQSSVQVPTGAPATNIPPTPTAAANASTPTPSAANVSAMDAIFNSMVQKAGNQNLLNADQWGYYFQAATNSPAPDPLQLIYQGKALNRSTNWPQLTSAQYWAAVAPLVAQQRGLQGIGALAGLGRFVGMRGRRA